MNRKLRNFSARVVEAFERGPAAEGLQFVAAKSGEGPVELLIYDAIGASFWDEGITAASVTAALARADGAPVRVRLNSPGGDVFEGLAIYNVLRGYKGGVETVVDGVAASAASIIALAGSPVVMQSASMMMIHNASTVVYGNRHEFEAMVGTLAKIDSTLAGIYAAKTGKSESDVAAMLDAETWLTSAEAVEGKFADSVIAAPEPVKAPKAQVRAEAAEPEDDAAAEARAARLRKIRVELTR